jgi:hypothetical protein
MACIAKRFEGKRSVCLSEGVLDAIFDGLKWGILR